MEADYYQTPHCLTQAFVDRHVKVYWEPETPICDYCSGGGAIVRVLHDNDFTVYFSDIRDPINENRGHGYYHLLNKDAPAGECAT
jgi:2-polyprenyl-3-methyl-5-hydroxy-6-metoxy-1,4-benzoquinol methylase